MILAIASIALLSAAFAGPGTAVAAGPRVAVLDFGTAGLTSNQWGQFQPGVALSDLLTDQVVNSGKFDVVDRKNLDSTLQEHRLSASGEVDPTTAISAGRLVGARFLISGNVIQLDQTGQSGAAAGGLIGGVAGGIIGGVKTNRVTIKVAVKVVDAQTGRIVQTFSDEKTESATSWGTGGFSGYTAGAYSNSQFVNSSMGHLINDEAILIAQHLDPSKFTGGPAAPSLTGRVIDVDGANIIINLGASKGAQVGAFFDVVKVKQVKDPDSGRMLTVSEPVGKIQIMSVSSDTAVARVVSGHIVSGLSVVSE
ncbi:MAG TPA: CsgG/HfaB family protein [Candidatus Elarobacter sp.]|jgi:curli biogenesis system outer membrane secretion channel CsgG|nr:CsgG/HfaB family protein [Candidatus Elarobacter sp.]